MEVHDHVHDEIRESGPPPSLGLAFAAVMASMPNKVFKALRPPKENDGEERGVGLVLVTGVLVPLGPPRIRCPGHRVQLRKYCQLSLYCSSRGAIIDSPAFGIHEG